MGVLGEGTRVAEQGTQTGIIGKAVDVNKTFRDLGTCRTRIVSPAFLKGKRLFGMLENNNLF